jgi:hypothetical protein
MPVNISGQRQSETSLTGEITSVVRVSLPRILGVLGIRAQWRIPGTKNIRLHSAALSAMPFIAAIVQNLVPRAGIQHLPPIPKLGNELPFSRE